MKVLMGVDGSTGAFAAVQLAGRLLSPQDQVALYYTPPDLRPRSGSGAEPEVLDRAKQSLAKAVFDEALTHLPAELRPGVHTIVGTKNPR